MERRGVIKALCVCAGAFLDLRLVSASVTESYRRTLESLRMARSSELGAYHRYVSFSRRAREEGYAVVSYLFTALASSELIHAQNYERVLLALGSFPADLRVTDIPVADTRSNLIYAAEREVDTIDNKYPA